MEYKTMSETDYPTDEFGRPNGRNYHYRCHINDEKGMEKMAIALKFSDRFVAECDCCEFPHYGVETNDDKGHISYLTEYSHSKQWESPFTKSRYSNLEFRYANGGGCKVQGSVVGYGRHGGRDDFVVNTTIGMTLGEIKKVANHESDELRDKFEDKMNWILRDAKKNSEIVKEECNHDHKQSFEDSGTPQLPDSTHWCTDCGKEFREETA